MYRRSGDGGSTWSDPVQLSGPGANGALAQALNRFGTATIDAVWLEFDAQNHFHAWYRRSLNNGFDWGDRIRLTSLTGDAGTADVARFGDRVTVAYTDGATGQVNVRISTDGGETFAPKRQVGVTSNQPYSDADSYDGFVGVVDASGTITVVWDSDDTTLLAKRSTNGGATWSAATTLATNADGRQTTILSAAAKVIVGYTSLVNNRWRATQRRTLDEGVHWQPAGLVGGEDSFLPVFGYGGGVLRLAYERCLSSCSQSRAFFETSSDFGATWTTFTQVNDADHTPYAYPVGVVPAAGGQTVVIYTTVNGVEQSFIYARRTR
jgi:hypothetical protein